MLIYCTQIYEFSLREWKPHRLFYEFFTIQFGLGAVYVGLGLALWGGSPA